MDEGLLARYLSLFHSEFLSTLLFSRLLQEFGNITAITALSEQQLTEYGFDQAAVSAIVNSTLVAAAQQQVEIDLEWNSRPGHRILCYEGEQYPRLLREIASAPPILYVVGNTSALSRPQIAIVGSRKASSYGSRNAYWLAYELGTAGFTICSGLARGIDSKAHEGALAIPGSTTAVMATGADLRYPSRNKKLAEQITEAGALVSEFSLGTKPMPYNFPRRNRIISGMSLGTLVIEAGCNSGSLITARLALEQNRDVFAIPGSILSQATPGVHRLIKEGAKLVEAPIDILEELGWPGPIDPADSQANSIATANGEATADRKAAVSRGAKSRLILDAMGYQSCLLQTLAVRTGLDLQLINSELLMLEIEGEIENRGGRYCRLK